MQPPFRILGPLQVEGAEALGGPRPRALLRALLLAGGETVSPDRLIEAVWPEEPPDSARHALHVHLSQLRKAIPGGSERLVTEPGGYRAAVGPEELDSLRFQRLAREGRERLAAGDPRAAAGLLDEALGLWRGAIECAGPGDPDVLRLGELRLATTEDRLAAALELGRHREAVSELERLVREQPLRERPRGLLMLALYRGGRQAAALAVYREGQRLLDEELGLEPGPELRELELAILRHDPALAVAPAARVRLPAPATPLIGRRAEVAAVRRLLAEGARLVTLLGPGGVGKTRLAIEAAGALADSYPDGVIFVELGQIRDPGLVAGEVAAALGIEGGPVDAADAVAEHLARRRLLLVIDNFEQLDAAAPLVSRLLAAAPGLACLVTSRRPLRLYGEHRQRVPPLHLWDEAVALFAARAAAVGATIEPSPEIAELCVALDRLPLAVELVAARAVQLTPAQMLDRLPARLALAADGPRDVPERHRTLEAAIAWSHELLDDGVAEVFEALSVFSGGWEAGAAQAVAGAAPSELEELAAHSLVLREGSRFGMLDTIREFAAARLAAAGRAADAELAHAEHFAGLAEEADRELRASGDQAALLDALEREHDNLRAALDRMGAADRRLELRLAGALASFWAVRGHTAEGYERLCRALDREPGPDERAAHAKALTGAAIVAWAQGAPARGFAERALALYRELGDAHGIARSLANLGYAAASGGDIQEARAHYEECLAVARGAGSRRDVVLALGCLSDLAVRARELGRARAFGEEMLALARELGEQEGAAVALMNLGYAALYEGEGAASGELLRAAARAYEAIGDPDGVAYALNALAATEGAEPEAAARLLGAAAARMTPAGEADEFQPEPRLGATREARAALGEDDFARSYAAGRRLGLEAALALSAAPASPSSTRAAPRTARGRR